MSIPLLAMARAALAAVMLPIIPTWAGIHSNVTVMLWRCISLSSI